MEDGACEVGYHIGGNYTGRGYATEAVKALLPVVMQEQRIRRIAGLCLADNQASVKVMERCGFIKDFEGVGPYQGQQRSICKFHFDL
jgi:RimJ/RimL family protein N-acetyltransferase